MNKSKGMTTMAIVALVAVMNKDFNVPIIGEEVEERALKLFVLEADEICVTRFGKSLADVIEDVNDGMTDEELDVYKDALLDGIKLPGAVRFALEQAVDVLMALLRRYGVLGNKAELIPHV